MDRPILFSAPMVRAILAGNKTQTRRVVRGQDPFDDFQTIPPMGIKCPYGQPTDRLWVRETWGICPDYNEPRYRADKGMDKEAVGGKWKPSIHMPRKFSRITLEIADVRVERLRNISEADAIAEGVTPSIVGSDLDHLKYRAGYQTLWKLINGEKSWNSNPWVWVIEFRRTEP